jgi:hypothetical protein
LRVQKATDSRILSPHFTDSAGEPANLVSGVPTVTVTRADGTVLTAPTATAQSPAKTGQYQTTLTAAVHTSRLDWLTVTWTGTTSAGVQTFSDTVEVVGGFYLSIAELRDIRGLDDSDKVTSLQLRETCNEFEDLAELYTGVAYVPRFARETFTGRGYTNVLLGHMRPRSVVVASSVSTTGAVTTFTLDNWRLEPSGVLVTDGDVLTAAIYGEQNLTIEYEHGLDRPPASLVRACRLYCQWQLLKDRSQVGRDIRSVSDPSGFNTTYSMADWDQGRPTGIGEIDQTLNSLGRAAPRVG